MKTDYCLPVGDPPTGPRKPDLMYRGYSIWKTVGGSGECSYRKPSGIAHDAKSVTLAMVAIDKLEGKAAKGSGAVVDDGPQTFRIGRDRTSLALSRRIVEDGK